MAVGMATSESMPRCPVDCGGALGAAFPGSLSDAQRANRKQFGCDKATAHPMYTITCPHCEGSQINVLTGVRCDKCVLGEMRIHRCPTSHIDTDLSIALRHYPHAEQGRFPESGGVLEQSPSYLQFQSVLSGEIGKIRREESEEHERERKARSAAKPKRK